MDGFFFALYTKLREKRAGNTPWTWKPTVLHRNGKKIVFLETIEEQIEVLDSLSLQQIIDFFRRIDHWKSYMDNVVKWYLDGDLEQIASNPYGFPTRKPSVIESRDEILHHRMVPYLEKGDAAVFVGSPHIVGIAGCLGRMVFLSGLSRPDVSGDVLTKLC